MKNSEKFYSLLLIILNVWLIYHGEWIFSLFLLLIPSIFLLMEIGSFNRRTTQIWKPLYISFLGIVIGVILLVLKFNKWIDGK